MELANNVNSPTVDEQHSSSLELIEADLSSDKKLERDRACETLRSIIIENRHHSVNGNKIQFSRSGLPLLKLRLIEHCQAATSSTLMNVNAENATNGTHTASWGSAMGALSALLVFAQEHCIDHETDIRRILPSLLALLEHSEVRVRLLSTDLTGALAPAFDDSDIVKIKNHAYALVRDHLERHMDTGNEQEDEPNNFTGVTEQTSRSPPPLSGSPVPSDEQRRHSRAQSPSAALATSDDQRRSRSRSSSGERLAERYAWHESKQLLHETAGWKILETSMRCLQRLAEGLKARFKIHIDNELLQLLLDAASHTNRFVRESCQFTCGAIIGDLDEAFDGELLDAWAPLIVRVLYCGMSDNWSQVRYAASVGCRQFFRVIQQEMRRIRYYPTLIPPMCLNRYYMAEGVKQYSVESWHVVFGLRGKQLVTQYIDDIIDFYLRQVEADNHAVREAACHCLAELATKIDRGTIQPRVPRLVAALLQCFEDDSWPVRDTACLASGSFIENYPDECRPFMPQLFERFFENLIDTIASVRQGGAQTLAAVVWTYRADAAASTEIVAPRLRKYLTTSLASQPASTERNVTYEKSPGDFSVVKRITGVDERAENQQMYSCGSLAPKMHRGGCSGGGHFRVAGEPWEAADGSVLFVHELCRLYVNESGLNNNNNNNTGNSASTAFGSACAHAFVPVVRRSLAARFVPGLSPATSQIDVMLAPVGDKRTGSDSETEAPLHTPETYHQQSPHPVVLNSSPSTDAGVAGNEQLRLPPLMRRMSSTNRGSVRDNNYNSDHVDPIFALIESTVPLLLESTRYKHYASHTIFLKSVMRVIPQLCRALGKHHFKQTCLEQFCEAIFYALQNDNFALSAEAGECLKKLSQLLGPSILAARIEIVNPQYARIFEQYEQQQHSASSPQHGLIHRQSS